MLKQCISPERQLSCCCVLDTRDEATVRGVQPRSKTHYVLADCRTRNGRELQQERFRLDIWKNVFPIRVMRHWCRLPREQPSLNTWRYLEDVDAVLRDVA